MILPIEVLQIIVSFCDGFERENMRPVCKAFNNFKIIVNTDYPARDREVSRLRPDDINLLGKCKHYDIIIGVMKRENLSEKMRYYAFRVCYDYGILHNVKNVIHTADPHTVTLIFLHACSIENMRVIKILIKHVNEFIIRDGIEIARRHDCIDAARFLKNKIHY